ncbi:OpgC domain-containing protein [Bradyrhizobium sp. 23]|uniref:OpgC family protein n=1 Tax=Bradyrhizobium sp. 23 TaxID=2782667 RepID=UPI001FFA404C|nr:OpgC domain-containing protein [Bradyrhizobium sp. 23]MCK1316596.1 OpgC domain-containing protein [Bradyrhizobium sp. 23]
MSSSTAHTTSGRDPRLDLFRGLANWAIFLDHTPHEILSWLTVRNYGFSDAADLFVFISGYTAALVFLRILREKGYGAAAARILKRVFQLYAAHLGVLLVYVCAILWVSYVSGDPDDVYQFNVAAFTEAPLRAVGHALLLTYKPVNLDVLPLYIALLAAFIPGMWLLARNPSLALALSLGLYLASRSFGWNLPGVAAGVWFFNPFTWQFLFFLGAWVGFGAARPFESILRSDVVFWIALGVLGLTLAIALRAQFGVLPAWIPNPFDPAHKTNLAPSRIVHFVALALVANNLLRPDSSVLRWRALAPMIACGKRSLPVFCSGVVLSFCAHSLIELGSNALWVQLTVGLAGLALMTTVAYALAGRIKPMALRTG